MKLGLRSRTYNRKSQPRAKAVEAGWKVEHVVFLALALLSLSFILAVLPAHGASIEGISPPDHTLLDTPPTDVDPPPGSDDPTGGDTTPPGDPSAPPGADDPIGDVPSVDDPTDSPGDSTPPPGTEDSFDVTGWWYNEGLDGAGVSIEVRNNVMFLAWYTYDEAGNPIWHISGGLMTSSSEYSGSLTWMTGWPLGSVYVAPAPGETVGTVSVSFQSSDLATLSWNLNAQGQGSLEIKKFLPDLLTKSGLPAGEQDPRDMNGWWWFGSDLNGMGLFVEARGGLIFIAWYHYRDDSTPRWWSGGGNFTTTDSVFEGNLTEWVDGWTIDTNTAQITQPTVESEESVSFILTSETTAELVWNGITYSLERFQFDQL